jgi:glutamate formiminotransferase/formiminotetrahydrofolate cyclodeaminase
MERRIVECVPNFSEGRDLTIIKQITDVIEQVEGVMLLDVDPGKDTNRTVVTFAGDPSSVAEAAFLAVKKASELIDMSKHKGAHPRMGATDVLPFVPVSGISMDETVILARKVAERIGRELGIPVFCYENAAFTEQRRNLAYCRQGEYEGLPARLADPAWKPDFGPTSFNIRSGATAVGARDFLVAYNINLNTTSTRRANAVAFDIREKGRTVKDADGKEIIVPGTLKKVKAIGWYIEEYGIAQISMNLTDISVTPVHIAFEEACRKAESRGMRVSGSELVGLIPLKSMLDAGRYFLEKQQRSAGVSDKELIRIAVKSLGLNDLHIFKPEEKIIEYVMEKKSKISRLVDMSLRAFVEETASESPAPGGGSVAAGMGALGVALGTMVANLSSHKKGWDERWKEFSDQALRGKAIYEKLLLLVDEDTNAFNKITAAYRLPKETGEEKKLRDQAVQDALKNAMLVPLAVMETASSAYDLIRHMTEKGNPNSVSDAGVGALALRACISGAYLNILINAQSLKDEDFVKKTVLRAREIYAESETTGSALAEKVFASIGYQT